MKQLLSTAFASAAILAAMSIPAFAAEPVENKLPKPVIIEGCTKEASMFAQELKFNGTVNLTASSSTPIVNVRTGWGTEVIRCFNDGPGAVEFSVGTQSGSVAPGQGIQFTVPSFSNISVLAKASWSAGAYPIRVYLN